MTSPLNGARCEDRPGSAIRDLAAGVRDAIETAGASLLYLPPYSPDFNPIENA